MLLNSFHVYNFFDLLFDYLILAKIYNSYLSEV